MKIKNRIALLLALACAAVIFTQTVRAQQAEPGAESSIQTIGIPEDEANLCVDVEPLDDGFGWNGTCTCQLPNQYEIFGSDLVTDGNFVVVGARQSPLGCDGSGSVTVYQTTADGTLNKMTELVSRSRQQNDSFAYDFRVRSLIALDGEYLAVGAKDPASVSVFKFDGSVWEELYNKPADDFRGPDMALHNDSFMLVTDSNLLTIYQRATGEIINTVSIAHNGDCTPIILGFDLVDETMAVRYQCAGRYTALLTETTPGVYQQNTVFENELTLTEHSDGRLLLYSQVRVSNESGTNFSTNSYERKDNGEWSAHTPLILDLPQDQKIVNGQLLTVAGDANRLTIYELSPQGSWEQVQEYLSPHRHHGALADFHFSENRLAVIHTAESHHNGPDTNTLVTVFERQGNQWQVIYDELFARFEASAFDGENVILGTGKFLGITPSPVTSIHLPRSNTDSTVVFEDTNGVCDYTDADQYDGWGWNATTMTACPPENAEETEIINAQIDETAEESTPAITEEMITSEESPPAITEETIALQDASAIFDESTDNNVESDLLPNVSQSSQTVASGGGSVNFFDMFLLIVMSLFLTTTRKKRLYLNNGL